MDIKGLVIIATIVLCSFPADVHGKLKCIQCGFSPDAMVDISKNPRDQQKLQEDIINNPDKFFCPKDLPAPTECSNEHDKYCMILLKEEKSVRFCSAMKIDGCQDGGCAYSCDTDGCNVSIKPTEMANKNSAEHSDTNNVLMTFAAIFGLLCSKFSSP